MPPRTVFHQLAASPNVTVFDAACTRCKSRSLVSVVQRKPNVDRNCSLKLTVVLPKMAALRALCW
ncbi:hypothetical protein D3C72_1907040 [compost metagenome]